MTLADPSVTINIGASGAAAADDDVVLMGTEWSDAALLAYDFAIATWEAKESEVSIANSVYRIHAEETAELKATYEALLTESDALYEIMDDAKVKYEEELAT